MMFSNVHKNTSPFLLAKRSESNNKVSYKAPAPMMFGFSKQYMAANRKMVDTSQIQRILPTQPPAPVMSDSSKMKWGNPIWTFFHLLAHKVKDEKFNEIRLEILNNIYSICSVLPCPICSDHAKKYMNAVNFNNIRTKRDLKNLICNFHNDVNKRKGYAIFNAENLDETYDPMNFINVINHFIYHFEDKHRSAKLMADDMMRAQISVVIKNWIRKNIQCFSP